MKNKNKYKVIYFVLIITFSIIRILFLKINIPFSYGIIISSKDNYFIFFNGFSKFYVNQVNNTYELFDIVQIKGNMIDYSFTNYESQFDFNKYLNDQLVFKQIDVDSINMIFKNPIRINHLYKILISNYSEEGKTIISKLIFNKNYNSDFSSFITDYSLFSLLTISSFHVYYLSELLRKILETKISSKKVNLLIIFIVFLLFLLSSYKVGILRVLLTNILKVINEKRIEKISYLERLITSLILIIVIDPSYPFSISFLYSLLIPVYFILIRDGVSTFKLKYQNIIKVLLLNVLLIIISIYLNDYFSLVSLLLTPLLCLIVIIIFMLGLLNFIFPFHILVNIISKGLLNILSPLSKYDLKIYYSSNKYLLVVFLFTLLFLLIYFLENKRKKYQKVVLGGLIVSLVIFKLPIYNCLSSQVYFINVGQGDSTLIQYHGFNILIDTGGVKTNDIAKDTLIPFFKKHNVYYLDYVFLTHNDYDHVGGFDSLITNFKIKDYNQTNNFTTLIVGNIEFKNLNPSIKNEDNDDSLVLYFKLDNKSYLFMGDVSIDKEKEILKKNPTLKVDILKVGHHGSSTSTSEELLETYNIDTAIISCGRNNYYNHPSNQVIDKLKKYKIEIRRTDIEGTIKI